MSSSAKFNVSLVEKRGNIYVSCIKEDNNIVSAKNLDLESFYNVLSKLLKKEDILFDTGAIPKNLIKVAETTNYLELVYHYDSIVFDYHVVNNYPLCSSLNELEVEFKEDLTIFKNIRLDNVILRAYISKNSNPSRFQLYLYDDSGDMFDKNYLDSNKYITFPFPNYYQDHSICWGRNVIYANKYQTLKLDDTKTRSEIYSICEQLPYDFLNTVFNSDLSSNRFTGALRTNRNVLRSLKNQLEDYYNPSVAEELIAMDNYPSFFVALILNFIYSNPQHKLFFFDPIMRSYHDN